MEKLRKRSPNDVRYKQYLEQKKEKEVTSKQQKIKKQSKFRIIEEKKNSKKLKR